MKKSRYTEGETRADFATTTVTSVVRWNRSGRVPPEDILRDFYGLGLITEGVLNQSMVEAEIDTAKAIAEYRAARSQISDEQRAEEAFEMRAAFGPGAEVVDIITGQKIIT